MSIQRFHLFLFLIIFLSCILFCISKNCTIEEDLQKILSPCDPVTNRRTFSYIIKNECKLSNSTLQKYLNDYFIDISCNTHCPPGHYLNFDKINTQVVCQKCPQNTFNPGKDLNIQKWNNEILNFFEIVCKTKDGNNKILDIPCNNIVYDNNIIKFNIDENYFNEYHINIGLEFNSIDNGSIMFEYFINETNLSNNEVNLNIEFDDVKQNTDKQMNSFEEFNSVYMKGFHTLKINFTFVNHNHNKNDKLPSFVLKSFKAFNIFDVALECLPCKTPQMFEGSTYCLSSSNVPSIYEYLEDCNNKEIKGDQFTNNQGNYFNCLQTLHNNLSQNKEISGKYNSFYVNFDSNNFSFADLYFSKYYIKNKNKKWLNNGNSLCIPEYAEAQKYVFATMINIISFKGMFSVQFELQLMNDDEVYLKINRIKTTVKTNEKYSFELNNGFNEIKIIFKRLTSVNQTDTNVIKYPVKITNIKITGVEKDNENELTHLTNIECPFGYIRSRSDIYTCIPLTYSNIQHYTFNHLYNDNEIENTKCPLFTSNIITNVTTNNNSIKYIQYCELQNIFEYLPEKIRYNFTIFKNLLKSNLMTYDKTFLAQLNINSLSENEIIPLLTKNNDDNIKLFYSLFKPTTFHFTNSFSSFGHIFGIKEYNDHTNQLTYITLARKISEVKIIKNKTTNIGFIIKYDKGDICLNDNTKNYQVAVLFKCDKRKSGFNLPHIIKKSEDKCTIITQISSKYFCKQCISSEINKYQKDSNLPSNLSDIYAASHFYQENDDCLIVPNSSEEGNYTKITEKTNKVFFTSQDNLFNLTGYNEEEFNEDNVLNRYSLKKRSYYVNNKFVNEYWGIWILDNIDKTVVGIFICCMFYFVALCVVFALVCKYIQVINGKNNKRDTNAVENKVEIQ